MKKINILIAILLLITVISINETKAQITSSGIATSVPINDSEAIDGDIICSYREGARRCENDYDPGLYGVISDNPAASIEDTELTDSRLIIASGIGLVRVSTMNGQIKEGDFITSSPVPGVGQLASRNGYVLGAALEDYGESSPENIGRILVMVGIHPATTMEGQRGNLIQFIREGIAVPIFEPLESLRYLLAVAIVIISFTLGMIYFGRASRTGIEAVGRNPLAKRVIQYTVVLNIVLTIVIVLVGLGIAYMILIL